MIIGIPKETYPGETRVACTPAIVALLRKGSHEVLVEKGAGTAAFFNDAQYVQAGARIVEDVASLYTQSEVICKVQPLHVHPVTGVHEAQMLREGMTYIGFLAPFTNQETLDICAERKITTYAMECIPRIARAQNMDALSAMATIAGYKAVLLAAERSGKMFPLLMTAAGTVSPATVLVLGAGVAGLQAIATAHRLGAKVEAFDPRPSVREQVKSVGATFIEMELPQDSETAGGYAKELPADFLAKEQAAISARLPSADVVITTAQIFGKPAPILITEDMVGLMRRGAILVDLAAEQGGNCALTQVGHSVEHKGVTLIGEVNLPARIPFDASQLYARNVYNLFHHLYEMPLDSEDEIARSACITRDGAIVHPLFGSSVKTAQPVSV